MIIVMGYITLQPSDVSGFAADMQKFATTTRAEDGCLFFSAAVDEPAAGCILVDECWQDQQALTTHLESPTTETFVEIWAGRMKGDILKFNAANERGPMD